MDSTIKDFSIFDLLLIEEFVKEELQILSLDF
jgi:hypothetical protein